jgi:hypothetical protein
MDRYLVAAVVLLLTFIWPSCVWAAAPQPPDCREESPAYLETIADPDHVLEYFDGWDLQSVRVCQGGGTEVFVQYVAPAAYSSLGLTYRVTVRFVVEDNAIAYGEQLQAAYGNYRARLAAFENNPSVQRFVQSTGFTNVDNAEADIFEINPSRPDSLTFSSQADAMTRFAFTNPRLIEDLALYVPVASDLPSIAEFHRHHPIGYARFDTNWLYAARDSECPDCGERIAFALDQLPVRVDSYRLSNNFTWETRPEIAQAQRLVEEQLLKEELPNCVIGRGDMHADTTMSYRYGSTDRILTVALKCDDGIHWKDAELILHADGTYEGLRISYDSNTKPTQSVPGANLGCSLLPLAVAAVSTVVWRTQQRRRKQQ